MLPALRCGPQVQAQCGELPPPDVADLTPPEAAALRNPLNPLRDCVLYVLCPVSIPKTERWEVEAAVVSARILGARVRDSMDRRARALPPPRRTVTLTPPSLAGRTGA